MGENAHERIGYRMTERDMKHRRTVTMHVTSYPAFDAFRDYLAGRITKAEFQRAPVVSTVTEVVEVDLDVDDESPPSEGPYR